MNFEESKLVIANILKITPTNIIGGGNIIAVQTSNDKVFDFINIKEYKIIDNINNSKEGIYVEILNRPFNNSKREISIDIFKESQFEKYIKQNTEDLDNPEYVHKKNIYCSEDSYLYANDINTNPKVKVIKKD